ncbi:MAG TPA: hypothetical protein PLD05_03760 [Thermogutta sp.]|nr:hypothetical protein [Thermogutta sp.]
MSASPQAEFRKPLFWILAGVIVSVLVIALAVYLWPAPEVDVTYGTMGWLGRKSINGTWVLAEMVRRSGHSVSRSTHLSPMLKEQADCLIWFAADPNVPHESVVTWLEDWLKAKPGRTLIYVGRHFEATSLYWKKLLERFPDQYDPVRQKEIARRQALEEQFLQLISNVEGQCAWFSFKPLPDVVRPKSLEMHPQWRVPVNPQDLEIELRSQMIPAQDAEVLIRSEKHVLVARLPRGSSQILLVNNGSFLLNMMLVNREHRKLARRLVQAIDESGTSGPKRVCFLELRPGYQVVTGPTEEPSPYRFLTVYPLNVIVLHLFLLAVLFALARFPRLGPGYEPDLVLRTSFDAHLAAMARWLRRTRDYQFVQEVISQWERISAPRGQGGRGLRERPHKSRLLRY